MFLSPQQEGERLGDEEEVGAGSTILRKLVKFVALRWRRVWANCLRCCDPDDNMLQLNFEYILNLRHNATEFVVN